MKKKLKKLNLKSKQTKYIIISIVAVLFILIGFLIYKNLFASVRSSRLDNIEKHKLSNNEINSATDKFNELTNIDSVYIYTNYKIIKIFLKTKDDLDFEQLKLASNQALEKISKNNLSYYDVEIFVESANKKSAVYPKIGYKHKTDNEFVW